jgi:hypothetical protein
MATMLEEFATEEQHSVVRFFVAKELSAKDIHKEMLSVYDWKCLSRKSFHNYVEKFFQGRSKVTGRPVEITAKVTVQWVEEFIRADRK